MLVSQERCAARITLVPSLSPRSAQRTQARMHMDTPGQCLFCLALRTGVSPPYSCLMEWVYLCVCVYPHGFVCVCVARPCLYPLPHPPTPKRGFRAAFRCCLSPTLLLCCSCCCPSQLFIPCSSLACRWSSGRSRHIRSRCRGVPVMPWHYALGSLSTRWGERRSEPRACSLTTCSSRMRVHRGQNESHQRHGISLTRHAHTCFSSGCLAPVPLPLVP